MAAGLRRNELLGGELAERRAEAARGAAASNCAAIGASYPQPLSRGRYASRTPMRSREAEIGKRAVLALDDLIAEFPPLTLPSR